jgi:hypothetical protein
MKKNRKNKRTDEDDVISRAVSGGYHQIFYKQDKRTKKKKYEI